MGHVNRAADRSGRSASTPARPRATAVGARPPRSAERVWRAGYGPAMSDNAAAAGSYIEDEYDRDTNYIADRITADGVDGWPAEAGRYRLIVSRACPWANRAIIVRR